MANDVASPFVKIAGGKRGLLWRLRELMPAKMNVYFEGFVGGGALFFDLAAAGRFSSAVLSDANEELVRTWIAIQRNHCGIAKELDGHVHTRKHFEKVRALDPKKLSDEKTAARVIYLNRCCFNGLTRYNKSGQFNTPFGIQAKMKIFIDPQRLRACARVLNEHKVTIVAADFEDATRKARLGDGLYFDPVYAPVKKDSFTAYTPAGFDEADQVRLAAWFRKLDARGITALLSNSRCDLVERLYSGMHVEGIAAKRSINSVGTKRGDVREVLVMTKALAAMQAKR